MPLRITVKKKNKLGMPVQCSVVGYSDKEELWIG